MRDIYASAERVVVWLREDDGVTRDGTLNGIYVVRNRCTKPSKVNPLIPAFSNSNYVPQVLRDPLRGFRIRIGLVQAGATGAFDGDPTMVLSVRRADYFGVATDGTVRYRSWVNETGGVEEEVDLGKPSGGEVYVGGGGGCDGGGGKED